VCRDKAQRYFEKAMGCDGMPETVTVDKNSTKLAALSSSPYRDKTRTD
jgi:hypothetical protein